jgi:hypothetical protein
VFKEQREENRGKNRACNFSNILKSKYKQDDDGKQREMKYKIQEC